MCLRSQLIRLTFRFGCAIAVALVLVVTLKSSASAQNGEPETQATTLSSKVDEVTLDLVARSKNKPVLDLRPEDLKLTDSGTPVSVSSLHLVGPESGPRLLTLVIDRLDPSIAPDARKLAIKIVKDLPSSGFALSVLRVQGQLELLREFTSDQALLLHAAQEATDVGPKNTVPADTAVQNLIKAAKQGRDASGTLLPAETRLQAQVLLTALQQSQYILHESHPDPALAGLLALVRSQHRLPGMKVVLFITQDPSLGSKDPVTVAQLVSAASRSSVRICVIDANSTNEQTKEYLAAFSQMRSVMSLKTETGVAPAGGIAGGLASAAAAQAAAPATVQSPQAPAGPAGATLAPLLAIDKDHYSRLDIPGDRQVSPACKLARDTGGSCVLAGESPQKAMEQLLQEMSSYYEASFVPADKRYDGKFHAIKVKALRHGIEIKSRSGYFALPPESDISVQAFEAPLLNILRQPTLPDQLQFQSRVLQLGQFGEGNTNALVVGVPVSELETHDDPNANFYSSHVAILAQIKDKSGQIVQHFAEDIPQHGALDDKDRGTADSIRLQRDFTADPGEYVLEIAVLDRNSGKAAARRTVLQIADATRSAFLSDLTLVARLDALPQQSGADDPFRYQDAHVVAELSSEVVKGQKQISFFSVVHLDPQSKAQQRMEMTLERDGKALAHVPVELHPPTDDAALPYLGSIRVSSLPAGSYRVIETLTQGDSVVEKSTAFRITGPELASADVPATAQTQLLPAGGSEKSLAPTDTSTLLGKSSEFVITAAPPNSVTRPSADQFRTLVSAATKYALTYSKALPNFVCMELTKRSVDSTGRGDWKERDSFAQLLRYADNQETRTLLTGKGEPDSALPSSVGQFGGVLNLVFQPASKTVFEWQNAAMLGTDTVQILRYSVSPPNASMVLRDNGSNRLVSVGFHGLMYIDPATGGIRRITLEADNIPRDFLIHSTSMVVDYDYVTIGPHEYLLPTRAQLSLQRANQKPELNEIVFRNYRHFASQARILPTTP